MDEERTLAERWWDGQYAKDEIGDGLTEAGLDDYEGLRTDDYDSSLEIDGVGADVRLSPAMLDWIWKCGFAKIYVNHADGWETHYGHGSHRGWRRRYVSDPTAKTDRILAGDPDPGYFEISYWPEGWDKKEWLETGYMRIVPDPLEPPTPPPASP